MLTLGDIAVLAKVPHFSGVSMNDVTLLSELLTVAEYGDGERLIREGDTDDEIFILLSGEVRVTSGRPSHEQELSRMGPGDMLGLLALVDNAPRSASCIAVGGVRAARLTREAYRKASTGSPALALAFHRALGAQLARDYRTVAALLEAELPTAERRADRPTSAEATDCDVAVLGAGPLGMMYAQWLRRMYPGARVVMLERRDIPGYKIGESTLSTTVRAFLDMGFTMPQLRRLFGNKTGIRFFWVGPESERPEREVDVVDLEETFQVERRVFELALQRLTREAGIEIRTGTQVEIESSDLDGVVKRLDCVGPHGEYALTAKIICDATGPAAVLPRHLGLYRKDPSLHDSFQTNCYFAYFRQKKPVPLLRWQDPATRHLCMPQGWVWFITLHSWESADDQTIAALVNDVMDHSSPDDADLPSRRDLASRHGAEFSLLTSIGITVREDMDTALDLPIEQRFQHYVQRYPAFGWIMEHYELVEQPYREKRRPYAAFLGLAHDCTQIAGDGWVAIGDSAQFSNPLFSHGLNYGSGTAYMAAVSSAEALASGDTSRAAFSAYERYGRETYPVLLRETDFFYRSWAHPDGFERTLMAKFHFGALDVTQRESYSETDPWVFDLLNPEWLALMERVREVEKRYEAAGDADGLAAAIAAIVDPFNAICRQKAKQLGLDYGEIFTNYDGEGRRLEGRDKPRGFFNGYQCPTCMLWQDDTLERCPICATANARRHVPTQSARENDSDQAPVLQSTERAEDRGGAASTRPSNEPDGRPSTLEADRANRRRFRSLRVAAIREETATARSLVFEVPEQEREQFRYAPGQFLTLQVEIDGEPLNRCYSLSSVPSAGEPPTITVKRIAGGRVSNWLCDRVKVGERLDVLPPDGRFTVPDRPGDLFLFAAGSGITPVWSIAQEALVTTPRNVRLLYVNRSVEETIFRGAITELRNRAARRFKLIERIGRREGRLDTRDVQAYCDGQTRGLFFVCGPWGFMDVVEEGLLDMGVAPEDLHVERFASPLKDRAVLAPAAQHGELPASLVTFDLFGVEHQLRCAPDQTLTEAAFAAGVAVPTSCEEGYCGTCIGRLTEGKVECAVDDALSKGQKKRGFVLACQAKPRSASLRVIFE